VPVGINGNVECIAFIAEGKDFLAGGENGKVRRWRTATGAELPGAIDAHPRRTIQNLSLSKDGKILATGSLDPMAKVWDATTGKLLASCSTRSTRTFVALSPDGKSLVTAFKEVCLWDVSEGTGRPGGKLLETLELPPRSLFVDWVTISPDGLQLAACHRNGTTVWDLSTRKVIANISGHSWPLFSLAFSPDGKTLATGGYNKAVRLWELGSQKQRLELVGHMDSVQSVAFSPDGKLLVSGGADVQIGPRPPGEIKLWDAEKGKLLAELIGHTNSVKSVVFAPDGQTVASASKDSTIKLWDVSEFTAKAPAAKPDRSRE
jgi:WD40 repeat protein